MNNQNLYHEPFPKDITTESNVEAEPVSLQEMKDYMRLEGFVDVDESTTESLSDFGSDDTLISNMIVTARKKAERFCGISIVFHSWKDLITNCAGDIALRMGPVTEVVSVTDKDGNAYDLDTEVTLRGFDFQTLESPNAEKMVVVYDAGYDEVPEGICLAIKQMVFYWYEHRGDEIGRNKPIPESALALLWDYKQPWTYVG